MYESRLPLAARRVLWVVCMLSSPALSAAGRWLPPTASPGGFLSSLPSACSQRYPESGSPGARQTPSERARRLSTATTRPRLQGAGSCPSDDNDSNRRRLRWRPRRTPAELFVELRASGLRNSCRAPPRPPRQQQGERNQESPDAEREPTVDPIGVHQRDATRIPVRVHPPNQRRSAGNEHAIRLNPGSSHANDPPISHRGQPSQDQQRGRQRPQPSIGSMELIHPLVHGNPDVDQAWSMGATLPHTCSSVE